MWLGIDFGTCLSSAAFLKDGVPTPVKFGANVTSLPSSVYVNEKGDILVGAVADRNRQRAPSRYRREFKRDLGQKMPYQMGGRPLSPEQLVAEVLRKLREEAQAQSPVGEAATSAVLTAPANYKRPKRELMREAGRAAGFTEVELLDEPVAAAIYYASRGKASGDGETIMVYDLGGGTFDAALIRKQGDGYESLAMSAGHDRLGGVDFDRKIYDDLLARGSEDLRQRLCGTTGKDTGEEAKFSRLRDGLWVADKCRELKHHLSEDEEAVEFIPWTGEAYTLRREEFNGMIAPLIAETVEVCRQLVRDAGLKLESVDRVLLVGGSCRIPYVREAVAGGLGLPVARVDDPELAVCLGAAVHAEAVQRAREEEGRRPTRNQYRRAVDMAWADERLERQEVEKLGEFETELGLSKEEASEVEREVMGGSKEEVVERQRQQNLLDSRGKDIEISITISREEASAGTLVKVRVPERDNVIGVKVPAGVREGTRLRLARKGGEAKVIGGEPGDLYAVVHISEHERPKSDKQSDILSGSVENQVLQQLNAIFDDIFANSKNPEHDAITSRDETTARARAYLSAIISRLQSQGFTCRTDLTYVNDRFTYVASKNNGSRFATPENLLLIFNDRVGCQDERQHKDFVAHCAAFLETSSADLGRSANLCVPVILVGNPESVGPTLESLDKPYLKNSVYSVTWRYVYPAVCDIRSRRVHVSQSIPWSGKLFWNAYRDLIPKLLGG